MTDKEKLALLTAMHARGIYFATDIEAPCGATHVCLSPEDVLRFIEDKTAVSAEMWGVTKYQFIDWLNDGKSARCAAKTKKGHRCKHNVANGIQVEPQVYVQMQGEYCTLHSGEI